ncbi:Coenzyme Q-binding protein coq10, mitochondrial [Cystobasidiomycetes sp. EMM_F5]
MRAYADPSSLFKVLRSTWTLTPTPRDAPHMSKASPPRDGNPLAVPGRPFSTSTLLADAQSVPSDQQNPTMVSIDLAYEFANPLYRIAAGQTFQDVSRKIMGAFEKRVQIKYGDGVL